MFKIGIQTVGLTEYHSLPEAYRLIKEAGFDTVDCGIHDVLFPPSDVKNGLAPDYLRPEADFSEVRELVRPFKELAKQYGLENYQAHSFYPPCNLTGTDKERDAFLINAQKKMIEACAEIGCTRLVIHPYQRKYAVRMTAEEAFEFNIDAYSTMIETAKKNGVTILLENLFLLDNHMPHYAKRYAGMCGTPEKATRMVDVLNDIAREEVFGFCLDTGHALISSQILDDFITALGSRIKAFHVNDNDGRYDLHLAPYEGQADWNAFVTGLAKIHYTGSVSFETVGEFRADPVVATERIKHIAAIGRRFDVLAEEKYKEYQNIHA